MKRYWLRLAGEWLAIWWCIQGILKGSWKSWLEMHPLKKCTKCGIWVMNQSQLNGECVDCSAAAARAYRAKLKTWIAQIDRDVGGNISANGGYTSGGKYNPL